MPTELKPLPLMDAARASYESGEKMEAVFYLREALNAVRLEVLEESATPAGVVPTEQAQAVTG